MAEIGLGQFIKNVFGYSTGKPVQQQPGKVANENFQKAQDEAVKTINQAVKNIAENFVRQHEVMTTQMQLKDLSGAERSMLMKNLFDFPSNMKDLALFLASQGKTVTAKELNALMSQSLDLSKLLVLLQTNGKTALEKIQKLITTMNQSGVFDTRQLKEMAVLVNACIPANDASSSQILKSIMIMYLPWLPLNESAAFNLGAESENDAKNSSGEDVITIMITTKNYGMVKVLLYKEGKGFNLDINCTEEFPKDALNEAIKSENTSSGINSTVIYTTRVATEGDKSEEPKVEFAKTTKISPQLLVLTHTIIKLVMEVDAQGSLVQSRKNF